MVQPQWVIVDKELHHVSEFAHLVARDRPQAYCPVCARQVILKLGSKRIHHFAHQPDDVCAVTNPETALHFNLKMHIAQELKQTYSLYVENPCQSCYQSKSFLWASEWDTVEVEYGLENNFRPDVALIKDGQTIVAIEVLVTHAIEQSKADFFKAQGIKWIEISGSEDLYCGESAWRAASPLPRISINRLSAKPPKWLCSSCQKAIEIQKEEDRYRYADHAFKPIDIYWPNGEYVRYHYKVRIKYKDEQPIKAYVFAGRKRKLLASLSYPINSLSELNKAVKKHVAYFRNKRKAIVDEFLPWQNAGDGNHKYWDSIDLYPRRWKWSETLGTWELQVVEKGNIYIQGPYRVVHKGTGEVFYIAVIDGDDFIVAEPMTGIRKKIKHYDLEMQ